MVFLAIGMLAIIAVLALVIDAGRLFVMKRQAQSAADSMALAGASRLKTAQWGDLVAWDQWVSARVAAQVTGDGQYIYSKDSQTTPLDMFVTRGLWCENSQGRWEFIPLERNVAGNPDWSHFFCHANAVQATIESPGIDFAFGKVLGIQTSVPINEMALSYILPPICGFTLPCDNYLNDQGFLDPDIACDMP